jgi:hypothetical protein
MCPLADSMSFYRGERGDRREIPDSVLVPIDGMLGLYVEDKYRGVLEAKGQIYSYRCLGSTTRVEIVSESATFGVMPAITGQTQLEREPSNHIDGSYSLTTIKSTIVQIDVLKWSPAIIEDIHSCDLRDAYNITEIELRSLLARVDPRVGSISIENVPALTDACLADLSRLALPHLERLSICGCRNVTAIGLQQLRFLFPSLRRLKLRRLAGMTAEAVHGMLAMDPNGDQASRSKGRDFSSKSDLLGNMGFQDPATADDGNGAADVLGRLPSLVELDVGDCPFLTRKALGKMLKECPRLETLKLDQCKGLDERLHKTLAGCIRHKELLRHLDLAYCTRVLIDRAVTDIVRGLPGLRSLRLDGSRHCTEKTSTCLSSLDTISTLECPLLPSPIVQIS